MKSIIIALFICVAFSSCYCGTHLYYMEEVNTHAPLTVRDWGNFKVGQIVEEGRHTYRVINIIK